MISFNYQNNTCIISHKELGYFEIQLSVYSGKIIERDKALVINHTGIYLGFDLINNVDVVIHHSNEFKHPKIDTLTNFHKGNIWRFQNSNCTNSPFIVITKALNLILEKQPYNLFRNNCQIVTSLACDNKPVSKDASIGKVILGVATSLAVAFVIDKYSE